MQKRSYSLGDLASLLDAELNGDADYVVSSIATIDIAKSNDITFLSSDKYEKYLEASEAGAVVLAAKQASKFQGNSLVVDDPYFAYAKLSQVFDPRRRRPAGIHPSASVADTAEIHESVSIGAHCVVGENVKIGANTEIYPGCHIDDDSVVGQDCLIYANVSVYSNVRIGDRVILHSGAVIGSDGFGFAPTRQGWEKIHQIGGVVIGNDVEIGASTAIDRGALDDTIIADGVIIDNQVHIAHNVKIGRNSAIAGCVGIAGSADIGENCTVAGAVAINGHITIADNTHFHGGTIVTKGITESGTYASAPPVQEVKKWRRNAVRYGQLDDIVDRIRTLEKRQKQIKD